MLTNYINAKRIVGVSLLLSMMAVQTVGAAGDVDDSLKSKGNIEYDADGDGKADVLFYSKDLNVIAGGVDELNANVSNLQTAYNELSAQSDTYKTGIINAINGNVYANQPIDTNVSYEELIDKLNNISSPTVAYGSYYAGGNNDTLGVGVSDTNSHIPIEIAQISETSVGVNEAITLPSGYYPGNFTVNNGVTNWGAYDVFLNGTEGDVYITPGYYDNITITTSQNPIGNVVYVHHIHSLTSTEETEENTTPETSSVLGGFEDTYSAEASGGCFTEYKKVTKKCSHGFISVTRIPGTATDGHDNDKVLIKYGKGSICGQPKQFETWSWNESAYTHNVKVSEGYVPACGYENGQVIGAVIDY